MCGIAGYLSRGQNLPVEVISNMTNKLEHRGPDATGVWHDNVSCVALGHRRLAIVDLSSAGQQPMVSRDGRFVLVYNGEIYNHLAIRMRLEKRIGKIFWVGHSDTETLLVAVQHLGFEATLQLLNGMFAIALWDTVGLKLWLARDRMGEKPLYYAHMDGHLLFASELKAFAAHPHWRGTINRDVLSLYFRHGYVPDSHCIFVDAHKLPPAHFACISLDSLSNVNPKPYWALKDVAQRHPTSSVDMLPEAAVKMVETRLDLSVSSRMMSDVPLGAFLSGGIDSSTIVATMQKLSTKPINTFTIGFDVPGFNEMHMAEEVARHLGTDHHSMVVTPKDAMDLIPDLPKIWDEPFADSSQLPTLLLSRMTREHVTVALSGDGGDEVFCGYNRYLKGYELYSKLAALPGPIRTASQALIRSLPSQFLDQLLQHMPARIRFPALGDRLQKLADVMDHRSLADYYYSLVSQNSEPELLVTNSQPQKTILSSPEDWPKFSDDRETMMYLDSVTYLPGDILTKVDRATMAYGLEARVPFLDHELIKAVWEIPLPVKLQMNQGKWLLREILSKHVSRKLFERPKMGFGIPIEHWLIGPLREWVEELLGFGRIKSDGYLNAELVCDLWAQQLKGKIRKHHQIWTILMFQSWIGEARKSGLLNAETR